MKQIIIAYVPVVHRGYLELFKKYPDAQIYIFGSDIISRFPQLRKDLRALNPNEIKRMLTATLALAEEVRILDWRDLDCFWRAKKNKLSIIMPGEDICRDLAEKYLPGIEIQFENVFLRYDKTRTLKEDLVDPDVVMSCDELDRHFMGIAVGESQKSEDWWRQVGAILVRKSYNGSQVILVRHNEHMPTSYSLYIQGDPRGNYSKGLNYEFSTAIHAEAGVIATAANWGISTHGLSLYTSTFPCPPCAKILALSGIENLYFRSGYSVLGGQELLKQHNIRIIQVK
ncbi:MAG: hypothetical protein ABR875_03320 [Minisyncoccia bacterium]